MPFGHFSFVLFDAERGFFIKLILSSEYHKPIDMLLGISMFVDRQTAAYQPLKITVRREAVCDRDKKKLFKLPNN